MEPRIIFNDINMLTYPPSAMSAPGTKRTSYTSRRSAASEEQTFCIPANIGSEQSELNLAIHSELPTTFAARLIYRNPLS